MLYKTMNRGAWILNMYRAKASLKKPIQGLHYLGLILNPENIKEKPEETLANADLLDIAFKNITNEIDEYKAYFQVIDDTTYPGKIIKEVEKKILKTDFSTEPKAGEHYYFAGLTQGKILPIPQKDYGFIQTETKERLTFNKTVGFFYVFDVTSGHRGDEHYEGCSGSPILDADGNIVSLVTHRNPGTTEVCGINLVEIGKVIKPLIELGII